MMSKSFNRREFILRGAGAVAAANLAGVPGGLLAAEVAPCRLGTCGPPPRKNPQRQTSAEGLPPLPIPAAP